MATQLEAIADKAQLHRWIDGLPDSTTGLIIVQYHDPGDAPDQAMWIESHHIGLNMTRMDAVYLMRATEFQYFKGK